MITTYILVLSILLNFQVGYNLPMEGSPLVENVTFGGNNFGPVAMDGIRVHRLSFEIR